MRFAHAQAIIGHYFTSNLLREAAARGLLEVSLCRRLRKTPTDSSCGASEEGSMGAAAKASWHNRYYIKNR